MSRSVLIFIFLFLTNKLPAQNKKPEDYGFRYLKTTYKNNPVDILILSKKGEEQKSKPLFLFIQGSQPQPLIKYDQTGIYMVFPFKTDSMLNEYHLAIIGKPYIPVI